MMDLLLQTQTPFNVMDLLLQTQTPFNETDITGGLNNGMELFDMAITELTSGVGEPLFALFIAGFVFIALYFAAGGSFGVPAVIMTLASSWLMGTVPPQYRSILIAIVIVGIAAGVFRITQKYFLRPNV